ncbi:MAG TPA: M36 family metallopeptidase, partial [Myxococcaceae bacterium]|nr:M36 family metallopeptidase [Myxococcaceae bacterium]
QILFRGPKGLEPAYYLELDTREGGRGASHAYAYVISARDGRLLVRTSLTQSADPFTYRVWADSSGQFRPLDSPRGNAGTPYAGQPGGALPAIVPSNLVTLVSGPISTGDPWLPPGATETRGNNVDAYADLIEPDGFTAVNPDGGVPDLRANTTSASTFDYAYDTSVTAEASATQIKAAVTQLFFTNNWLHDWYYDVGFDEAAGNAQASNLGRTSPDLEEDPLHAEADDFSGLDNANMTTPADGASPRMQMYVFEGPQDNHLTVNSPAAIAGTYQVGVAAFGPQGFNVSGAVALVNDGVATLPDGGPSSTSDGCEGGYGGVAGKMALVDRGNCTFVQKVANAQAAGAIGVVVANNNDAGVLNMGFGNGVDVSGIVVPSLLVTQDLGTAMKGQLGTGVNVTLFRQDPSTILNVDGALDDTVVAHEWGHYIAHRLVGGGDGFNANITNGMGEGWSDFHALLLVVRPEDASATGNAAFGGIYPMAQYAAQDGYFGIRRYPYSTDMTKNPLTFAYIQNGKSLPAGIPVAPFFDTTGADNSEVHNTGEVWASMLWECYAALLNDTRRTFQEAQDQMRRYLVAAYKATPVNATFTEARDALLAVALANDPVDYQTFGRAFAKRGLGTGAIAPNRLDPNNSGPVESFTWGKSLELISTALQETKSCDNDGVVDHNESGKLVVTLRNLGADAVGNITVTATSLLGQVTLAQGGVASLASLPATQTAQVELPFDVGAITGIQILPISLSIASTDLPASSTISSYLNFRINTDQTPASSATDSVEATTTTWTTISVPHLGSSRLAAWTRIPTLGTSDGSQHEWLGPDPDFTADESLVSPPLTVAASGDFKVTFRARWDEETEPDGNFYDGVVLEISEDNGATWKDVTQAGGTLSPPYNHTLFIDPTEPPELANPLQGRPAYSGNNPAYGAFDTVTLDFGTAYAGKTVLLRFRLGADGGVGANGFELDDIAFTG